MTIGLCVFFPTTDKVKKKKKKKGKSSNRLKTVAHRIKADSECKLQGMWFWVPGPTLPPSDLGSQVALQDGPVMPTMADARARLASHPEPRSRVFKTDPEL